jgi:hypothetical protein
MSNLRTLAVACALLLALTAPSCRLFRRTAKTVPPPPPPPPPVETTTVPVAPAPPQANVPPPPQIPPGQPDLTRKPPDASVVKLPPPPRGRRHNKKEPPQEAQAPGGQPAGETQASAPQPVSPPPAPAVPQLEQILSPEQRQAYNEAIDTNITRAQRTLELVQGRRLNPDQKMTADRVRAFLQQAAEARKTDLFRAKNLAERASVLADDLLRSMQ